MQRLYGLPQQSFLQEVARLSLVGRPPRRPSGTLTLRGLPVNFTVQCRREHSLNSGNSI